MRGFMRGVIGGLLVIWTAHWLVAGWDYLQAHSIVVQQGFGNDGIQMWEVFNIKMIAAHHAVRWGVGAAAGGLALYLLRRRPDTAHDTATASHASPSEALPAQG